MPDWAVLHAERTPQHDARKSVNTLSTLFGTYGEEFRDALSFSQGNEAEPFMERLVPGEGTIAL